MKIGVDVGYSHTKVWTNNGGSNFKSEIIENPYFLVISEYFCLLFVYFTRIKSLIFLFNFLMLFLMMTDKTWAINRCFKRVVLHFSLDMARSASG